MRILPSKRQWRNWSLPSKLTAIGTALAVISIIISLAVIVVPRATRAYQAEVVRIPQASLHLMCQNNEAKADHHLSKSEEASIQKFVAKLKDNSSRLIYASIDFSDYNRFRLCSRQFYDLIDVLDSEPSIFFPRQVIALVGSEASNDPLALFKIDVPEEWRKGWPIYYSPISVLGMELYLPTKSMLSQPQYQASFKSGEVQYDGLFTTQTKYGHTLGTLAIAIRPISLTYEDSLMLSCIRNETIDTFWKRFWYGC